MRLAGKWLVAALMLGRPVMSDAGEYYQRRGTTEFSGRSVYRVPDARWQDPSVYGPVDDYDAYPPSLPSPYGGFQGGYPGGYDVYREETLWRQETRRPPGPGCADGRAYRAERRPYTSYRPPVTYVPVPVQPYPAPPTIQPWPRSGLSLWFGR